MSAELNAQACRIAPRHALPDVPARPMWRVVQGVLRIDSALEDGRSRFVRMAMPGDVVGVERWAGTDSSLRAYALTEALVEPVQASSAEVIDILVDTVVTAHQRGSEALELRSGPVAKRVQRLLLLLATAHGNVGTDSQACAIPHLVDMSEILDAAPETVSRVFSSLRGQDYLQERTRQRARFDVTAMRGLQSVAGMTSSVALRISRSGDLDDKSPVTV